MALRRQSDDEGHGGVIPFRQRQTEGDAAPRDGGDAEVSPEGPVSGITQDIGDDGYRHRMLTNVVSLVAVALLVIAGVWLALAIADLRKNQDCALSGRRNCTPIEIPSRDRW